MPFRKVTAGEPFSPSAPMHNALLEMLQAYRAGRLNPSRDGDTRERRIWIKNTSGSDVGRYKVLGLGAPITVPATNLDEFLRRPMFLGVTPTTAHAGKFAITTESIKNGEIGTAIIDGVVQCRVFMNSAGHQFADAASGITTYLSSSTSGSAQLLWTEATSSETNAIVRLEGPKETPGTGSGDTLWRFALTEDMGETTVRQASATIINLDGGVIGSGIVHDPDDLFIGATSSSEGLAILDQTSGDYFVVECKYPRVSTIQSTTYDHTTGPTWKSLSGTPVRGFTVTGATGIVEATEAGTYLMLFHAELVTSSVDALETGDVSIRPQINAGDIINASSSVQLYESAGQVVGTLNSATIVSVTTGDDLRVQVTNGANVVISTIQLGPLTWQIFRISEL